MEKGICFFDFPKLTCSACSFTKISGGSLRKRSPVWHPHRPNKAALALPKVRGWLKKIEHGLFNFGGVHIQLIPVNRSSEYPYIISCSFFVEQKSRQIALLFLLPTPKNHHVTQVKLVSIFSSSTPPKMSSPPSKSWRRKLFDVF